MDFLNNQDLYADDWLGLDWKPKERNWIRLDASAQEIGMLPKRPGIYRIRHPDREGLEYIGETGNGLNTRIKNLARGVRADKMPFRDPHTASPCLWAILDKFGGKLEFSYCSPEVARSEKDRKGLESIMIAIHRKVQGESPTANFGRIIKGYDQSSYSDDGHRGGRDSNKTDEWESLSALNWSKREDVKSRNWLGLNWKKPHKLEDFRELEYPEYGLYKIWFPHVVPPLAYIGQSKNLEDRISNHVEVFGKNALFSVAETENADTEDKREELETEAIGVHYLQQNVAPKGQWGEREKFE